MRERGFILGGQIYVLGAAVFVVLGLLAGVAYYKNQAGRYEAEAALARDQRDRAVEAVKASEEANQKLQALNASLDAAIVERDKRAKALVVAQANLRKELGELRKTLDEKDIACLDRDLPDAILERLRGRPGNPDEDRNPKGP